MPEIAFTLNCAHGHLHDLTSAVLAVEYSMEIPHALTGIDSLPILGTIRPVIVRIKILKVILWGDDDP